MIRSHMRYIFVVVSV